MTGVSGRLPAMNLMAISTAAITLYLLLACLVSCKSSSQPGGHLVQASSRIAFALNDNVSDWMGAYQMCKSWNSMLSFPASAFQGEMLREFLIDTSDNSTKDIHLGFHSMFAKGLYTTMQGHDLDSFGFGQWDPASENGTEQRCGALTVDGMKTIDCSTRLESICEFKETLYYDKIDGFGFYRFHELTWNWTEAISTCKIQSANLLVLRSTEEYEAIFNFYSETGIVNGTVDVLYGAHQLFAERQYLTIADDLLELSGYEVWAPGEPGDVTAADFPLVGLHLSNLTTPELEAGLFALPWGSPLQFICKQELH